MTEHHPQIPAAPTTGAAGTTQRTWTIELPAGMELLTSNHRSRHWGKAHRITQAIVNDTITLVRAAKIPPLDRVSIVAEWQPPTGRRKVVREAHNLAPSVKAAVDGIVRAGVLKDDSDKYVTNVDIRPGETYPLGRLVLHITEVESSC